MRIPKKLLLIALFIPTTINAYSDYIIASGENIGINIKSKGVLVVGTYKVGNEDIAGESQIKPGDIITKIANKNISNINDLIKITNENCDKVNINYERENQTYQTTLNLKKENNICKTGLYVKDEITGIGTLTYIDPNTKLFGALGHEIIDSQTGKLVDISDGTIFESEVIDIKKSTNDYPGEKNARYNKDEVIGNINENTNKGIFGSINNINDESLYKVANPDEIKLGEAEIITVLEGNTKGKYKINITKLNKGETKNIIFKVTDPVLLSKTGGIVQGMSGSPIIQDNKIIGAVTHVVVGDPLKGYGIFITNMLKEGED